MLQLPAPPAHSASGWRSPPPIGGGCSAVSRTRGMTRSKNSRGWGGRMRGILSARRGGGGGRAGGGGRLLRRFADAVDDAIEELAGLEVQNAGHPLGQARWEAGHVRDVLEYYSATPERLFGRQIPVAGGLDVTFAEPLGVVGVITPWNFPMPIASW